MPPSHESRLAVTYPADSEARKPTTEANSSGRPYLPAGMDATLRRRTSAASIPSRFAAASSSEATLGVSIRPGTPVELAVDARRMHFFDPVTGDVVGAGRAAPTPVTN